MDDGAGNADPLLLAGGKVGRQRLALFLQVHPLQGRGHALGDLRLGHAEDLQRQGDVVRHRTIGEQLVVLEHHADLPAQERDLRGGDAPQVLAAEQQLAAGRSLHRQDEAQQGALAGAGVAGDEEDLATVHAEGHLVQAYVAIGIAFADLLEADHAFSRSAKSAWTKASASKVRRSSIPSPTPI